jgi:hypothetical protein
MKRINIVLLVAFLIAGVSAAYSADDEVENLFDNPGFEEGPRVRDAQSVNGWNLYLQNNGSALLSIDDEEAIEGDRCAMIEVTGVPAGGTWNVRFEHTRNFHVKKGDKYTMSFWLKGDPGPVTISPSRAEKDPVAGWGNQASKIVNPTPEWKEYYLTFVATEDRLIMWQLLISNPKQIYYVDYARCYEGEYVESEIKPVEEAVFPAGKLAAQWGHIKSK